MASMDDGDVYEVTCLRRRKTSGLVSANHFVPAVLIFLQKIKEFYYIVSGVPERYLRFPLILIIDFYYIINKLIILVPDPH
jgi:hypothetical protein